MNRTAVIVLSYRMAEMTDALVARLRHMIHHPHDLFVIDNGSPEGESAKSTTHRCEPNRRFTGGFNFGIECARAEEERQIAFDGVTAEYHEGYPYDAFWFVCNDIRLTGAVDVLAACMARMDEAERAGAPIGIIHPGMTRDPNAWNHAHMLSTGRPGARDVSWADIICPIYSRRMMEVLGWRFDPELTHGWGVDRYSCFEAWEHGLRVAICDDVEVWHKMGTTYAAGKDPTYKDFEAYKAAAGGGQAEVLGRKYGPLATERGYAGNYLKMFDDAPVAAKARRR